MDDLDKVQPFWSRLDVVGRALERLHAGEAQKQAVSAYNVSTPIMQWSVRCCDAMCVIIVGCQEARKRSVPDHACDVRLRCVL